MDVLLLCLGIPGPSEMFDETRTNITAKEKKSCRTTAL